MGLFFFETLRHRHASVPFLLLQSQVIRVDQLIYLLLYASGMDWNVVLRKKLFFLIVVNFIIFD